MTNMSFDERLEAVALELGDRFVRYVLTLPREVQDLGGWLDGEPREQQRRLRRALTLLEYCVRDGRETPNVMFTDGDAPEVAMTSWPLWFSKRSKAGQTRANLVREQAAAPSPTIVTGDDVVDALAFLVADYHSLVLLPGRLGGGTDRLSSDFSGWALQEPAALRFEAAVLDDPSLARLFPGERLERFSMMSFVCTSRGGGRTLQLISLAGHVVESAWHRMQLEEQPLSEQGLLDHCARVITTLRAALSGEQATARVRLGFVGVRLPDGHQADVGHGLLRQTQAADLHYLPQVPGRYDIQLLSPEESIVSLAYAGDVVLEMTLPYQISVQALSRDGNYNLSDDFRYDSNDAVQDVRLALSLVSPELTACTLAWEQYEDPLGHVGDYTLTDHNWTTLKNNWSIAGGRHVLTVEEASQWEAWAHRLLAERKPLLDVAITRTLRALGERADPADAIVDCVTAWESLVGSNADGLKLRVTASLAWLLEPDNLEARQRRRISLSKLYDRRSGIVHGNAAVDVTELRRAAQEALSVSVEVLRVLLTSRVDLLVVSDSATRSNMLILGG